VCPAERAGLWGARGRRSGDGCKRLARTPQKVRTRTRSCASRAELAFEAELRGEPHGRRRGAGPTSAGHPVIVLRQRAAAARTPTRRRGRVADGHYFVRCSAVRPGTTSTSEDPYMRMAKGFIQRAAFPTALWHNVMGGRPRQAAADAHGASSSAVTSPSHPTAQRCRLRGARLRQPRLHEPVGGPSSKGYLLPTPSSASFASSGPAGIVRPRRVHLSAQGRRREGCRPSRAETSTRARGPARGQRGARGDRRPCQGRPRRKRQPGQPLRRARPGANFGLSVEELHRIADKLPPGHSAVIVLVENLWERKFPRGLGQAQWLADQPAVVRRGQPRAARRAAGGVAATRQEPAG